MFTKILRCISGVIYKLRNKEKRKKERKKDRKKKDKRKRKRTRRRKPWQHEKYTRYEKERIITKTSPAML